MFSASVSYNPWAFDYKIWHVFVVWPHVKDLEKAEEAFLRRGALRCVRGRLWRAEARVSEKPSIAPGFQRTSRDADGPVVLADRMKCLSIKVDWW